ncbi:MAG: Gfo/Idh/MocA family oxidoreductase [Candidatus Omnitrophica bacterium]|nr:Gfo/Idh/MocA family oxidoreductase [Candidatus Omnitrophota bacterium]
MVKNDNKTIRRDFLRSTTAAGLTLALQNAKAPAVLAAANPNNLIHMGFIGIGNRGTQLLHSFMKNKDMRIAALCDVYEPYLQRDYSQVAETLRDDLGGRIPRMGEDIDSNVARYKDFRKVLEHKDVDAVCIATPDHWHAIQTIMAFEAGKDVYVEKPLSVTVHEGRRMADAAKRTGRINQVGLHRRSSKMYRHAAQLVRQGTIGKVTVARAYRISNMFPDGIGKNKPAQPVPGLDWDLWLGPRAERDFRTNIHPYKFRWWQAYSSQVGNWGVHYFDSIRWVVGQEAPASISAHGGRYALDDDRTIPDTMEATFELPSGMLLVFGQYEACGGRAIEFGELEFRGTLGNLYTGSEGSGYVVIPSDNGQFQTVESPLKRIEQKRMDDDLTDQHVRNFLDCVKSRKACNCDIETGHRSTTFAHLANIALATKSRIEWDAENEKAVGNDEANELLHYEYRKPWTLG